MQENSLTQALEEDIRDQKNRRKASRWRESRSSPSASKGLFGRVWAFGKFDCLRLESGGGCITMDNLFDFVLI